MLAKLHDQSLPSETRSDTAATDKESTFKRHKWMGITAASVLAFDIGLGAAMASYGENSRTLNNDQNQAARALHLVSGLSLIGLGMYQFWDGRSLRQNPNEKSTHGRWAHSYLGMLVVTGLLGILSSHTFVEQPKTRRVLSHAHMGTGAVTLGMQWMALINIPFGF